LARASFHGMVMYRETMERRQMFLFRLVDVVMELFAMAASISRARGMADAGEAEAAKAGEVADLFCRTSRWRVDSLFRELWNNDDRLRYALAQRVLAGEHRWMEAELRSLSLAEIAPAADQPIRPQRAEPVASL
jgi:hypothetical protein